MTLEKLLVAALRRHLAGGKPVVPEAGVVLWNLFHEIGASRTYHAAGPHPISFAEIEAYARLHHWPLQPRHVAIIRALDDAWLEQAYAAMGAPNAGTPRRFPDQAINPAAFDAVFG